MQEAEPLAPLAPLAVEPGVEPVESQSEPVDAEPPAKQGCGCSAQYLALALVSALVMALFRFAFDGRAARGAASDGAADCPRAGGSTRRLAEFAQTYTVKTEAYCSGTIGKCQNGHQNQCFIYADHVSTVEQCKAQCAKFKCGCFGYNAAQKPGSFFNKCRIKSDSDYKCQGMPHAAVIAAKGKDSCTQTSSTGFVAYLPEQKWPEPPLDIEGSWGLSILVYGTVAAALYTVGGVGYSMNVQNRRGHPHGAFWRSVPGLALDGMRLLQAKLRRVSYTPIAAAAAAAAAEEEEEGPDLSRVYAKGEAVQYLSSRGWQSATVLRDGGMGGNVDLDIKASAARAKVRATAATAARLKEHQSPPPKQQPPAVGADEEEEAGEADYNAQAREARSHFIGTAAGQLRGGGVVAARGSSGVNALSLSPKKKKGARASASGASGGAKKGAPREQGGGLKKAAF